MRVVFCDHYNNKLSSRLLFDLVGKDEGTSDSHHGYKCDESLWCIFFMKGEILERNEVPQKMVSS